jgi:starch synthase (maltosyl-transferring)
VRVRDWSAPGNLDADITRLNQVRRAEPALQQLTNISFHPSGHPDVLFYVKRAWARDLLCAITVNPGEAVTAALELPLERLGLGPVEAFEVEDLLTGERCRWQGGRQVVPFDPAERVGYVWRVIAPGGGPG